MKYQKFYQQKWKILINDISSFTHEISANSEGISEAVSSLLDGE